MAGQIKISSDSTCDLGPELIAKHDISIVPLYVQLGNSSHRDGVDITEQDIFDYVDRTGDLPKTSAPSVADYLQLFESLKQDDCEIVHISLGSGFSSSYQNANIASQELDGVYVVDSCNLSTGHGHVVMQAVDMAEQGLSGAVIQEKLNELTAKVRASFIIDNLNYLHKGGRCSSVAALGANLLKLKPCIVVEDGAMHVGKKYRGNFDKVLVTYATDKLQNGNIRKERVFITHTKCQQGVVEKVIEKVRGLYPFAEIHDTEAGSTITSHCGPNTLGVLFIEE